MQQNRVKWSTAKDFVQQFQVSDELLKKFIAFAQKEFHVQKDVLGFATSKELIRRALKAEIASQSWTEEGYYRVLNPFDKELIKAIACFK
jgi:hypothetical protein